jgi:peptide/nickel transport system ATP-binding protein
MTEPDRQNRILIEVRDLKKHFPIIRGLFRKRTGYVRAVDGITFSIAAGETLGLVGESGCGKTTTGNCLLRVVEPTAGQIIYHEDGYEVDIRALDEEKLRDARRNMQMIFQDPYSSLNPRKTLKQIVGEPLVAHRLASGSELEDRVAHLLEVVGLRPEYMSRYPHAFSGGQRQRIGIARALALRPKLIVADEPVSALDVSIQAQTLNLLEDLQKDFGLTYLFIAHDLSVVEHISDRVAVMYLGRVVELARAEELYANPTHPYTEALLSAVPRTDPDHVTERIPLPGDVPSPANPPPGCKFHPRCRYARDICAVEEPLWRDLGDDHWVACHRADELELLGIVYD